MSRRAKRAAASRETRGGAGGRREREAGIKRRGDGKKSSGDNVRRPRPLSYRSGEHDGAAGDSRRSSSMAEGAGVNCRMR